MNPNGNQGGLPPEFGNRPPGNPPPAPQGPQREFTQKALDTTFVYKLKRNQVIILVGILRQQQFPLGDLRNRVMAPLLEEFESTAITSITESDYKKPEKVPQPPVPQTHAAVKEESNVKIN